MSSFSAPPAKRRRLDFDEEENILVGPEEKRYTFHKDVLARHSKVLPCGILEWLHRDPRKGNESLRLSDVEPDIFKAYVQWSYSDRVILTDAKEDEKVNDGGPHRIRPARLYVVADQFGDASLRNAVVDHIIANIQACKSLPGTQVFKIAYGQTMAESGLRKLVLDWHAFASNAYDRDYAVWLETERNDLPSELVFDLLLLLTKVGAHSKPEISKRFENHDHDEQVLACATEAA